MTFKDWTQSLWDKVKTGGGFGGQGDGMESNMANGGFSGYKPNTAKHRALRETQQQPVMPEGQPMDPMSGMTGMGWEQPAPGQQPMSTGFTGMYPQGTGYQQPMGASTLYQQPAMQPTGFNPSMNGYAMPNGATGYQPMNAPVWPEQPGYMDGGMGNQWGNMAAPGNYQGMGNPQTSRFQPQEAPVQDNISYMPGSFVGDDGKAYSHVERVAVVSTVSACYRIIEFMRNNESVIVNTEQITDEAENQRCLDLLYGAAFAMKCSFTRISGKSIYLLAPTTVMVVPYDAIRRMSDQDMNSRWPEQDAEPKWDRGFRANGGYARERQSYQQPRADYSGRRGAAYQDDFAGFGGYNAAGFGR